MIKFIIPTVLTLLTACQSTPPIQCRHTDQDLNCVTYVKNYDADTVTVDIPGVHALMGNKVSVRVSGIDTPEIRGKTLCEKKLAQVSRDQVTTWLGNAKQINLKGIERGKYFRIVADVEFDGQSLANKLLSSGLAYPYGGGTKRKVDWCVALKKHQTKRIPANRR